ncbi:hypothetical protein GGS23DRAFT_612279 [Durotheca rogersii]|uniref:uncharacterized protein n=1 Tax=Durotheca rogersii TaxID=419775 RepID=UPI00221FB4B5|nr:uncharacterized protein GGS23DRAFT_612279 [Durotheca rogersii]KAI5867178.1 hypothetical protein GGS23DRAFT_612279 [Durotheca rogersii]
MASPQLAIARVSFSAVLLRPDPTPCSRPEIDEFLQLLDATISRCTPPNVQKCKQWILKNLVPSPARIAALGKYLIALANSYSLDIAASRQAREPSSKRKRLHTLYLLNDVLYHVHVRDRDSSFAEKLEPAILGLVRAAAAFPNSPKHAKKIDELVDLWNENGYFTQAFFQKLQTTIQEAPNSEPKPDAVAAGAPATGTKSAREAPFIMPAMHGDATASWYDLPAANWLSALEPNSTRPINPDMIKPLQLTVGPADKDLVRAVRALLADVDRIYNKDAREIDRPAESINQLGQRITIDEITGEVIDGETYYGWSRAFCEKMKQRREKARAGKRRSPGRGRSRSTSRSRSRSSSRSPSRPAFKRQRVSGSRDSSRSGSRDRRRGYSSRGRRRDRSYSSSRSPSPSRDRRPDRSLSQSQGRSSLPPPRPYDPPHHYANPNGKQTGFPGRTSPPPPPPPPPQNPQYQNPAPFPQPHSFPLPPDFSQFIVPPPLPPNFQGQWLPHPPPPPPPPIGGMPPTWLQGMPAMGGWPAPPPPPPVPPQQYGRGGRGEYHGHGHRGGWDYHQHRGRGR